jgi:CheY-like chemotaxis protein
MLTVSEDQDKLLAAFKAGARAYVLKGVSPRKLADVLCAAVAGEVYVSPPLAAEMLASLTRTGSAAGTDGTRAGNSWPDRDGPCEPGNRTTHFAFRKNNQALRHQHTAEAAGA